MSLENFWESLPDAAIIAASVTAVVAFVSKVIELIILRRNKKKEIDYNDQIYLNNKIRKYAAEIIMTINVLVANSTLFCSYYEEYQKSKSLDTEMINNLTNNIGENLRNLMYNTAQFELYFTNQEKCTKVIKISDSVNEKANDVVQYLNDICNGGECRSDILDERINVLLRELPKLSKEIREYINF